MKKMKMTNGRKEKSLSGANRLLSGAYDSYLNISLGQAGRKKRRR